VTADIGVVHHRPLELVRDHDIWIEAHIRMAEKWDGRMPGADARRGTWRERARRAEAEREAAQTIAYSSATELDARLLPLERAMVEATESVSWRITAPLRRLNRLRRRER
jgi:hypothetical protein